ncbi:MAG TPA: hypothetical protein PLK99_00060 [Burkholderiales bacterium]|nr:hypothetical protein [Burkholderiales bacterium]
MAYSDPEVKGSVTTGEVAEFLESKYHVMEVFYELYQQKIAEKLAAAMAEKIESIAQGNPNVRLKTFDVGDIELAFRQYLSADEWQKISGQRIAAAELGISHRKKDKKRAGPRPAFIDTGLYQQTFKSWVSGL